MIDFSELTAAEAQSYCDAYSAAAPERAAWLRDVVRRTGGPELDGTPDSLGPLWRWYLGWLAAGGRLPEPVPGLPPWQGGPNPYVSPDVLWVVDGIGCYLGEVLVATVPGASWGVYRVAKRLRDLNQHRTVVLGLPGPVDPASDVYGLTIGMVLHGQPGDPDRLARRYAEIVP